MQNKNTKKSNKKAECCLHNYLRRKKMSDKYWLLGEQELDQILSKFWFDVRTTDGEHYSLGSLESLRYGINCIFQEKGHEFDIVHGLAFKKSQKKFSEACTELKSVGKGIRIPYNAIKPAG